MRVPLEWLKDYIDIDKDVKEIGETFTLLGLLLGKPVEEYQKDNYKTGILDLEHRMDRSDWLSIIGCARDLSAFEKLPLRLPEAHRENGIQPAHDQVINIEVKCPDLVKRFNTRVFRNIKVGPSPDWLKNRLEAYGIPIINNIVDITNYVMIELGQPMHAQDIGKLKAPEIVIRRAKNGESITTLLGETIELSEEQFVLTQAGEATVIGGIVGGSTTSVDETTTDIVLDAGNYDQNNIRRSSRSLKISNETVLRYDKFLHPELTRHALERATHLILEIAGGEYFENVDWYPQRYELQQMTLRLSRLEQISGLKFELEYVRGILLDLGYKIINGSAETLDLEIPYFRTDVAVEDDIVSDVLRINNYNKIPVTMIPAAPPKDITPGIYLFEDKLRDILTSLSFHEHITNPLVPENENEKGQVVLENALTAEKGALRTNLSKRLKEVASLYEKRRLKDISIFEVGRIYTFSGKKDDYNSYQETRTVEVLKLDHNLSVYENAKESKKILASLMDNLGIRNYHLQRNNDLVEIIIFEEKVGEVTTLGFNLQTELLYKHAGKMERVLSEFQAQTTENLSLLLDLRASFGPIFEEIKHFSPDISDVEVLEEYTGKEIGQNKKTVLVRITYNTSETAKIREDLIKRLKNKHKAVHRDKK